MSISGLVFPAASIGLGSLLIRPRRGFFPPPSEVGPPDVLRPQVTLEERHTDELEITEHPVEQGAAISDHAYKRPAEVVITCAWSNSPPAPSGIFTQAVGLGAALGGPVVGAIGAIPATLGGLRAAQSVFKGNDSNQVKQIYDRLLKLQQSRIPFDVLTAKRSYTNMLFKTLTVTTDPENENNLMLVAVCRQVIIVRTQVISFNSDPETQADPETTQPVQDVGSKSLEPATMVPSLDTLSGSLEGLTSELGGIQETISELGTEVLEAASGALKQLPDTLTRVTDSISEVLEQLPSPLEVPLVSGPQSLSIPFEGLDFQSALGDAIKALPSQLESAQGVLIAAGQQLPSVSSVITGTAATAMKTGIEAAQGLMDNALSQLTRVIPR